MDILSKENVIEIFQIFKKRWEDSSLSLTHNCPAYDDFRIICASLDFIQKNQNDVSLAFNSFYNIIVDRFKKSKERSLLTKNNKNLFIISPGEILKLQTLNILLIENEEIPLHINNEEPLIQILVSWRMKNPKVSDA